MKFDKISTILIWSEDYKALADWYQTTFNLKVAETIIHPNDTGIRFEFPEGGVWLWIGQHSGIHGKNKDGARIMFNMNVASVREAFKYLKDKGVTVIAEPFKAPTFDKYFATFTDPDGNYFQIIGLK
ncbi:MAG: VOC family protein [Patescibacteria group bacterium]